MNNGMGSGEIKKKRMLLSEVYVHKTRKIKNNSNDEDDFEVFHIFEFADDENSKIVPKLSTNCTEPRKIIDVLQNSTGSNTPQLQRLIEKLCTQNKKWSETQTSRTPTASTRASLATTTTTASTTVTTVNDSQINKTVTGTQSSNNKNVPPSVQSPSANFSRQNAAIITRLSNVSNNQTNSSQPAQTQANTTPILRCRTIDSLKEKNQSIAEHSYQQAVAKKRVTVLQRGNALANKPANMQTSNPMRTYSGVEKQPVKLWNKVSQKELPMPALDVRVTLTNYGKEQNGSVNHPQKETLQTGKAHRKQFNIENQSSV